MTVTADMSQDEWLIGYLLSFGVQVEIIEPVHLKKVIAEKAKEIYEKNKTWHKMSVFVTYHICKGTIGGENRNALCKSKRNIICAEWDEPV